MEGNSEIEKAHTVDPAARAEMHQTDYYWQREWGATESTSAR